MKKELVWWTLVNSSATMIEQIKNSVEGEQSAFLCCESALPWKETFYALSRDAIAKVSAQRSLEVISAKGENDPGRFIMTKMCPPSVRSEYWPDMTYAQFLSQYKDLILNNRIIWVKDIENESLLEKWFAFISEYSRLSKKQENAHALFIIEYCGKDTGKKPPNTINTITFSPTDFDRYLFTLSMLSELNMEFSIKQYIAELACCLCKEDVVFCGDLAEFGLKLIQSPNACVQKILQTYRNDKKNFCPIDDDEIYSAILMAQIKIIFPVIEQFRLNFIKTHEAKIRDNLPIFNSFNEKIEEPHGLELSDLCSISMAYMSGFTDSEKNTLLRYKGYRNKLAHNDIINLQEIEKILNR